MCDVLVRSEWSSWIKLYYNYFVFHPIKLTNANHLPLPLPLSHHSCHLACRQDIVRRQNGRSQINALSMMTITIITINFQCDVCTWPWQTRTRWKSTVYSEMSAIAVDAYHRPDLNAVATDMFIIIIIIILWLCFSRLPVVPLSVANNSGELRSWEGGVELGNFSRVRTNG